MGEITRRSRGSGPSPDPNPSPSPGPGPGPDSNPSPGPSPDPNPNPNPNPEQVRPGHAADADQGHDVQAAEEAVDVQRQEEQAGQGNREVEVNAEARRETTEARLRSLRDPLPSSMCAYCVLGPWRIGLSRQSYSGIGNSVD